jgi:hypothetical protein
MFRSPTWLIFRLTDCMGYASGSSRVDVCMGGSCSYGSYSLTGFSLSISVSGPEPSPEPKCWMPMRQPRHAHSRYQRRAAVPQGLDIRDR